MRNLALLLLSGLWAVGCDDSDESDDLDDVVEETPPTTPPTTPTATPRTWFTVIRGDDAHPGLFGAGNVTAFDNEEGFNATVELQADVPGTVRPWHVHVGTCDSSGAVVGPDEAYPPLLTSAEGTSAATTNILETLDIFAYHIKIFESEQQFKTVIACGDLVQQ